MTLEPPTFPEPVISMAVEPKTKADNDKMSQGLQRLAEEALAAHLNSELATN